MPIISIFYGIIVRMYREIDSPHKEPHLHAEYQGQEVVVSLNGDVLAGEIPAKKLRMLLTWMDIHDEDIYANWTLLSQGAQFFKIDPLR